MIVELRQTTTAQVAKKLQELRESGGVVALGRVLSLIVETDVQDLEQAVENANGASKLHPSRIIVIAKNTEEKTWLDAEIRVGGDAGASEVVILRANNEVLQNIESLVSGLLLPDAPIVAWWPTSSPVNPGRSSIGLLAGRRITDSARQENPVRFLKELARNYRPGDGDAAWTRITLWRSQLAAVYEAHVDQEVVQAKVFGSADSPSAHLLAAWLGLKLGTRVSLDSTSNADQVSGIRGVEIELSSGRISMTRKDQTVTIEQPGQPISAGLLPPRSDLDCLVEDLRFLGEDEIYAEVLLKGLAHDNEGS